MYIPVMSFVTYIFLRTLIAGLRGEFEPELFGYTATMASIIMFLEILGLKLGCYLLSISNESQLLDLVAYSGYKFVGVIVTIGIAEIVNGGKGTGGWAGWGVFLYTFLANSLFLVSQALPRRKSDKSGPNKFRCDPSSMCCSQRTTATTGDRCSPCRQTRGRRGTRGRSSSFSIRMWSSSC